MEYVPRQPEEGINVTPTHPLRDAATLLIGFSLLATAALTLAIALSDFLIVRIPPEMEMRLFAAIWTDHSDSEPTDPRCVEIQALLDRLASHWPDAAYSFRLEISDELEVNAFAAPGGRVLVTQGLLAGVRSENELAFVLGHELGHFYNRDHLRGISRGLVVRLLLSNTIGVGDSSSLPEFIVALAARRFDREQERAADQFGLQIVQSEYGHVAGSGALFERLPDGSGAVGEKVAAYLSTHPLSGDRIDRIEQDARKRGWNLDGALTAVPGHWLVPQEETR